jgi:mannose-6-phosphate isomerase-like protein (cupin superfamily)
LDESLKWCWSEGIVLTPAEQAIGRDSFVQPLQRLSDSNDDTYSRRYDMYTLHKSQGDRFDLPQRTVTVMVGPDKLKSENMTFGITEVAPETDMIPHTHDDGEEIIFILEGTGETTIGESTEKLEPDTVVVFPLYVEHQVRNTGKTPMKFAFCFNCVKDFSQYK